MLLFSVKCLEGVNLNIFLLFLQCRTVEATVQGPSQAADERTDVDEPEENAQIPDLVDDDTDSDEEQETIGEQRPPVTRRQSAPNTKSPPSVRLARGADPMPVDHSASRTAEKGHYER